MRALLLLSALGSLSAPAQFLPIWEQFDSVHCVLSPIRANAPLQWPDTLWANGIIPVPLVGFDTVVVDQCCIDPDPPILLGRLQRWPRNKAGEFLPLFTERLEADTAAWSLMGEWQSMPDTMIPLTAHPSSLVRYVWNADGLESQTDHYGTWQPNFPHHLKRSECITYVHDSLKLTRCVPDSGNRTTEPSLLLLFVHDTLVHVFQDNRGTSIDDWNSFNRAPRATIITALFGGHGAIILSTGELLVRTSRGWNLVTREEFVYRGECDCE
ncbi:MAG: hypothetical protein ABI432_05505 [Flavobacteriales bacterium]